MDIVMADDDIMNTVKELIANHHPDLVMVEDEIAVLMREKGTKTGDGQVILGKSKKAPAIMSVLGTKDWKFIIEIAEDEWQSLNNTQRVALLDHHLCACRVDLDDASQGVKRCYIQPPDVAFYKDEVERHGFWRSGKTATPPDVDLIADLFGDD